MVQTINMGKWIKYSLVSLIAVLALYNSVYVESLGKRNSILKEAKVSPQTIAGEFFSDKVPFMGAIDIVEFGNRLNNERENYLENFGNKLGISDDFYFMVHGKGKVVRINDEYILVSYADDGQTIGIATEFIFGNAIREASGLFNIGDYQNTMDFNSISIALNDWVREQILPAFKSEVGEGDNVEFKGAIKVNKNDVDINTLRLIPIELKIQ